ncbi:helix-turn-helix domain-containing protein [Mycolicibacterium sp.]|uniref:helix-turn-helix domain-containing protein n=1 Tax=Mycolicibacterium sp. TaxID=2320850 RepID=UPI001A1E1E22|nr:helix-turn-helix domain-containing protein [Mycolicibacterium sp.]MBJ7341614.1 helix-turn-helix domain-containing protein [Mycolicibacterium sp.]
MTLSNKTIHRCAWVVGEDIARRQRLGIPIPQALTDTHRELLDELSAERLRRDWTREAREMSDSGHAASQIDSSTGELETSAEVAQRLGISDRHVRRHAAELGGKRVGNRWVYPREESSA